MCGKDKQYELFGDQTDERPKKDHRIVKLKPRTPEEADRRAVLDEMAKLEPAEDSLTLDEYSPVLLKMADQDMVMLKLLNNPTPENIALCRRKIIKRAALLRKRFS